MFELESTTPSSAYEFGYELGEKQDLVEKHIFDKFGNEIVAEPFIAEPLQRAAGAPGDAVVWAEYDLNDTFNLSSLEGADHTIYLDFDGHTTTGTPWNSAYGDPIVTPAYNIEGVASSFSDNELLRIQRIWARTAEDFAPFEINVTTKDPGVDALRRIGVNDPEWGIRVVIGPNTFFSPAGGVAYVGSFLWSFDAPVFVFNRGELSAAEAVSHEVGHALGLTHDGTSTSEYYRGHGSGPTSWAPIMGVASARVVTQWSRGEYTGASNLQDDLARISSGNGFDYRMDDYGNGVNTATELAMVGPATLHETFGIIERNTDVDFFRFSAGAGPLSISIDPLSFGANLDILAELQDSHGEIVATSNPVNSLEAKFDLVLENAGDYFLSLTGTGKPEVEGTGYSDYGSLGNYQISGSITPFAINTNVAPSAKNDVASTIQNQAVTIDVLLNDDDADGNTLSVHSFTQGANGSVALTANGSLTYHPAFDFVGLDAFNYVIHDGNGGTDSATVVVTIEPVVVSASEPKLVSGVLTNVGTGTWSTVTLGQSYDSMVVVATVVHQDDNVSLVTRLRNASGNRFDIKIQRADNLSGNISNVEVHYLVVEEGVYNQSQHGITLEAFRYLSTITDENDSWIAEERSYANAYVSPVVVGQVMSYNDPGFSVFWAQGSYRSVAPQPDDLRVGKHVGEDPDVTRNHETIGYVVVESGSGTIGGLNYSVGVGANTVYDIESPNQYAIDGLDNISSVVLSQAGLNGGQGSWAVLVGETPVVGSTIHLAIDEDQVGDSERSHTREQVAYFAFGSNSSNSAPVALNDNASTRAELSVQVAVLNNDFDSDNDALTISGFTQGSGGVVSSGVQPGTLNYSPQVGFFGNDTFTYTIVDGQGGSDTGTVFVSVIPNNTPNAIDDFAATNVGVPIVIKLLENDSDPDNDPISLQSFTQPSGGMVTDNQNGTVTYLSNGFVGDDTFQYTLADSFGATATGTVTVSVASSTLSSDALVAQWNLNGNAADLSPHGQNNSGTLIGSGQFINDSERGQVLQLNGDRGYVDIPDSFDINLGIQRQRTISIWFNAEDLQRRQVLFEAGGGARGFVIYVEQGNVVVGAWNQVETESNWGGTFFQQPISASQWHHVALTLDGGETLAPNVFKGYLDGQLFGSGIGSQIWNHSGDAGLGDRDGSTTFMVTGALSNDSFAGRLDDVRIYNRPLDASEIVSLYQIPANSNQEQATTDIRWREVGARLDQIDRAVKLASETQAKG